VRRLAIALIGLGLVLGAGAVLGGGAAGAQSPTPTVAPVDVIEATGLFDQIVADGVSKAIDDSARKGSQALVIQMDTAGATISRDAMATLAEKIHGSTVPVGIWVGPSGAQALGTPGQLLGAAAVTGMAPGTRIGDFGEPLEVDGFDLTFGSATELLRAGTLGSDDARARGALKPGVDDRGTPTLGDFVVVLDGFQYQGKTLDTAEVVQVDNQPRRQAIAQARFTKLGLLPRLMHTVASPAVAYLLLVIALCLLVFEFFTAGIGVAGVVGAVCLVLGCYGALALPNRPWALALLIVSILCFAVDVQTGVPRFWTVAGAVAFTIASWFLFTDFRMGWLPLVVGIAGVLLAFLVGMPSMVRARFATPTIGRDWMVGQLGEATVSVDPEGVVELDGAQWRARTNRATPIPRGGRVRVVAIDGVTLEVEPEAGGARDYRDRSGRRGRDAAVTAEPTGPDRGATPAT
jgi:membrane-bound serine protease (ClpP class)